MLILDLIFLSQPWEYFIKLINKTTYFSNNLQFKKSENDLKIEHIVFEHNQENKQKCIFLIYTCTNVAKEMGHNQEVAGVKRTMSPLLKNG